MATATANSILTLLGSALSTAQAEQIQTEVGAEVLQGYTWLQDVLRKLESVEGELRLSKAGRENDQVNHEQRLNDLETQFIAVTTNNTELKVKLKSREASALELEAELEAARTKAADAVSKCQEHANEVALQRQKLSFAKQETELLAAAVERKQRSLDQVRQELEQAKKSAAEAAQQHNGKVADLFAQRADENLRANIEFLEKERDLLKDSSALMEERHARLTEQFAKTKEDLTTRNKELEAVIPHRDAELAKLRAQITTLEQERDHFASTLQTTRNKMRDSQEEQAAQVSTLSAKAAKYEELAGNLQSSLTEAEAVVESLRRRHAQYRETTTARQGEDRDLLKTFQQDANAKAKIIEELRVKVKRLENDVAITSHASAEAENSSIALGDRPTEPSAMIQKLIEHTGSGTLSDWYDRIVAAEQERDKNVREKKHLHQLMNNILAAIEQQGPILKAQSDDYKRALESQQHLAEQIRELDLENEKLREESFAAKQLTAKNKALQKTIFTLEEASRRGLWTNLGGGQLKPSADAMQSAIANDGTSSDSLVRQHFLEYSNLAQLSLKHTELLQAYHELEATVDNSREESLRNADIEAQVNDFKEQLASLVKARERSKREIQSLIQQRDALQIALVNKDRSYLLGAAGATDPAANDSVVASAALMDSAHTSDSSPSRQQQSRAQKVELATLRRNLKSTQETFETYKSQRIAADEAVAKDLRTARNEANIKARDLSVAQNSLEVFRERVEELKAALVSAKAEALEERNKHARVFESLLEQQGLANKISIAREQDQVQLVQLRAKVSQLESHLSLREAECTRLKERSTELETQIRGQATLVEKVQNIESAVAAQKEAELTRLLTERDDARRTRTDMEKTIESLRTNIQRLEASARADAKERAAEKLEYDSKIKHTEQRAIESASQAKVAQEKYNALAAQHDALQAHIAVQKRQKSINANAVASVLSSSSDSQGAPDRDLSTQLSAGGRSTMSLAALDATDSQIAKEAAVTISRQATDIRELQVLLKSTEDAFEAQQATIDEQEANIKTLEKQIIELKGTATTQSEAAEKMIAEKNVRIQELDKLEKDLQEKLSAQQARLEAAEARVESVNELENELNESIKLHKSQADAAQERYRNEHREHEQDLTLLEAARATVNSLKKDLSEVKLKAAASAAQATNEASMRKAEVIDLQNRISQREEEVKEIEAQNVLLHKQMASLDNQIERAREASLDINRSTLAMEYSLENKVANDANVNRGQENSALEEIDRLKAMLKFHKERHAIVQTKLDLQTKLVDELQRNKATLEQSLQDFEKTSSQANDADVTSSEEHAKLMADVEQLHIYRESNQHLRRELKATQKKVTTLEVQLAEARKGTQIKALQEELATAKTSITDARRRAQQAEADRARYQKQAQNIVAQIDSVDPDHHKKVLAQLDASRKAVKDATSRATAQEKRHQQALLDAVKQEKAKADVLRVAIRKKNIEMAELRKSESELRKSDAEKASKIVVTERQLSTEKAQRAQETAKLRQQLKKSEQDLKVAKKATAVANSNAKRVAAAAAKAAKINSKGPLVSPAVARANNKRGASAMASPVPGQQRDNKASGQIPATKKVALQKQGSVKKVGHAAKTKSGPAAARHAAAAAAANKKAAAFANRLGPPTNSQIKLRASSKPYVPGKAVLAKAGLKSSGGAKLSAAVNTGSKAAQLVKLQKKMAQAKAAQAKAASGGASTSSISKKTSSTAVLQRLMQQRQAKAKQAAAKAAKASKAASSQAQSGAGGQVQ